MFQQRGPGIPGSLRCAVIAAAASLLSTTVQASETPADTPTAEQVVQQLGLEAHVEGGFFRRTYAAEEQPRVSAAQGERYLMTSIYYLLTSESPAGHFHRNRSDIVHYFHIGDPVTYYLLHQDGSLQAVVMGSDILAGQKLQLTVPGGVWKASRLASGSHGYGLISEAVAPGFDYADMTLGKRDQLQMRFPTHRELINELTRDLPAGD